MVLGLVCASHAPLFDFVHAPPEDEKEVRDALRRAGEWVKAFDPDVVIHLFPDHYNGFFYDVMPSFCLGTEARSLGDWGTKSGPIPVAEAEAEALFAYIRDADIDIALSRRMTVDHGFMQIWDLMLDGPYSYPAIPIFVNCAARPLPAYKRVRLIGEAIGRYAMHNEKRILLSGSGGLSHDPPIPTIETAPPERRELLIDGRRPSPELVEARANAVLDAAQEAAAGRGNRLPPDGDWDRRFLDLMIEGNTIELDGWTDDEVIRVAGCGGSEVRTWLAAFAALKTGGAYDVTVECHRVVPAWLTGMGIVRAHNV